MMNAVINTTSAIEAKKKRSLVIQTEYELGRFSVRETHEVRTTHIEVPATLYTRGRFVVCEYN